MAAPCAHLVCSPLFCDCPSSSSARSATKAACPEPGTAAATILSNSSLSDTWAGTQSSCGLGCMPWLCALVVCLGCVPWLCALVMCLICASKQFNHAARTGTVLMQKAPDERACSARPAASPHWALISIAQTERDHLYITVYRRAKTPIWYL